jgi:hypothetical protein
VYFTLNLSGLVDIVGCAIIHSYNRLGSINLGNGGIVEFTQLPRQVEREAVGIFVAGNAALYRVQKWDVLVGVVKEA